MMKDNREKVSKILIDFICLIFCIHFGLGFFLSSHWPDQKPDLDNVRSVKSETLILKKSNASEDDSG